MTTTTQPRLRPLLVLAGLVAACAVVAGLGSIATTSGSDGWYEQADRPWFTPPDGVFGPVWSVLYLAMAVAAWLAWRAGGSLVLWWVQLGLNLAWSPTFFAAEQLWAASVVVVTLAVAVAATAWQFRRVSVPAATLMLPYLAWVLFATALTIGVARLN